jgi:hypothetical protein
MRFKRFLAIILLLILPLQSTLAAIDSCCNGATAGQAVEVKADIAQAGDQADGTQSASDADCCALCDYCNHASVTFLAAPANLHGTTLRSAPVAHPELPIDSFIPDVPSRPDRA